MSEGVILFGSNNVFVLSFCSHIFRVTLLLYTKHNIFSMEKNVCYILFFFFLNPNSIFLSVVENLQEHYIERVQNSHFEQKSVPLFIIYVM